MASCKYCKHVEDCKVEEIKDVGEGCEFFKPHFFLVLLNMAQCVWVLIGGYYLYTQISMSNNEIFLLGAALGILCTFFREPTR